MSQENHDVVLKKEYIYQGFERFWHWAQAFLIIFLTITGFEVHGSFTLFGFENAVKYHNIAAYLFIALVAFAIFWHVTTGEWKQYIPTRAFLKSQVRYYITGIFQNEPHPTRKTVLNKLNPLQKLAYLGLKVLIIPVQLMSGLVYLYHDELTSSNIISVNLETVAFIHTAGAFALMAFIVGHIYLTTTGHTLLSNIKAMITGWEEIEVTEAEISKMNYPKMVQEAEMGYYFIDREGFIKDVNDAWLKIYGYSNRDEIINKHSSVTRREEHNEILQQSLEKVLRGEKIEGITVDRLNKDGSTGKHVLTANPVYFEKRIIGMAGFILDVEKTQ